MKRLLLALAISVGVEQDLSAQDFRVLVFSKTTLYRHDSITNGIAAIQVLAAQNFFRVDATEDSAVFTSERLANYKAVIFLNTSGDILNDEQQSALKKYLENGGGLAGVHASIAGAVATEGSWDWYGNLNCTTFTNHSSILPATVRVESSSHPSTAHLPTIWKRTDEWYNFMENPRSRTHVLASLDESTYKGGTMGTDHPIAWCHPVGNGRFWYTALGHTGESYSEPEFLKHILGGIFYAAQRSK